MSKLALAALVAALLSPSLALADPPLVVPAADGSDGAFNPTPDASGIYTVDLGLAVDGDWDATVARTPGVGIYDAKKFAVVFRYSSVNIPANVQVFFKNHSPNAPVVWLVRDSVVINGSIDLRGSFQTGSALALSKPGPGGFPGGRGYHSTNHDGSSGFGPGGGRSYYADWYGHSAGYKGDAPWAGALAAYNGKGYGNDAIIPLIGGSGGAANAFHLDEGGGSGAGAILIACQNTISFGGFPPANISATMGQGVSTGPSSNWWSGNGSGGAIRLVANRTEGTARVNAIGYMDTAGAYPGVSSANGRVRVEAFDDVAHLLSDLPTGGMGNTPDTEASHAVPSNPAQIWPANDAPVVQITKVNGVSVSTTPIGDILNNRSDLSIAQSAPIPIEITTYNVPLTWHVRLHVTSKSGGDLVDPNKPEATPPASCPQAGPCVWTVTTTIPPGFVSLLARASVN